MGRPKRSVSMVFGWHHLFIDHLTTSPPSTEDQSIGSTQLSTGIKVSQHRDSLHMIQPLQVLSYFWSILRKTTTTLWTIERMVDIRIFGRL